ncbi:MAG: hypothetical protein GXO71_01720 [Caldiserica bacterium]|nr:hypothetical protein [Caldisericota bacterium]
MAKRWHRNLYHLGVGILFPLGYYFASSKLWPAVFTGFLLLLVLIFEIERFTHPGFNNWVFRNIRGLVKEEERKKPIGTTFFLVSVLITILVFPKFIGVAALTFLALGDVSAAIVGEKWGRIKIFNKTLEGFLGFFIVALLSGWFLSHYFSQLTPLLIFSGALTSAIVEILPIPLDDNFTIPLITSLVMWGIY